MTIEYSRCLSQAFVDVMTDPKGLRFLLDLLEEWQKKDPGGLDLQLRHGDEVMLYRGGTCVLKVSFNDGQPEYVTFSAHKNYIENRPAFEPLGGKKSIAELPKLKKHVKAYLLNVMPDVTDTWYDSEKSEGYWENQLSCFYGNKHWRESMEWLIVDRQVIISHADQRHKDEFFAPFQDKYDGIKNRLYEKHKRPKRTQRWSQPPADKNEQLDMLAIGPDGELVLVELKHMKNPGLYWAPIQAAFYLDVFEKAMPAVSAGAARLIEQKVELGLLPKRALNRVPPEGFRSMKSILMIAEASYKKKTWDRLSEVIECIGKPELSVVALPGKNGK